MRGLSRLGSAGLSLLTRFDLTSELASALAHLPAHSLHLSLFCTQHGTSCHRLIVQHLQFMLSPFKVASTFSFLFFVLLLAPAARARCELLAVNWYRTLGRDIDCESLSLFKC